MLGNEFIIYYYGVFSFDVKKDYLSLVDRNLVKEYPKMQSKKVNIGLEVETKERIEKIFTTFGRKTGKELEVKTLNLLGLTIDTKTEFFTKNVTELIKSV